MLARYFSGTSAIYLAPAIKLVDADPQHWKTASPYWREIAIERVSGKLVRNIVLTQPVAYVKKVMFEYYGLWFLPVITTQPIFATVVNAFEKHGATLHANLRDNVKIVPSWAYTLKLAVLGFILLASLGVILAVLVWPTPEIRGLACLSLFVHAYFLFVAAVGVAVPRYMLMVWPLQIAIFIGAVTLLSQWRNRRLRGEDRSPDDLRSRAEAVGTSGLASG